MQDKDFDKLFGSKLGDLEFEPSASVWQGINNDLGGNRRKKFIPYLSIAASIIILITAGVMFIPQKHAIVKLPIKNSVAVAKSSTIKTVTTTGTQVINHSKTTLAATVKPLNVQHANHLVLPAREEKTVNVAKNETAVKPAADQQILAAVSTNKSDIKPALTDSATLLAATEVPVIQQPEKPALAANTLPIAPKITEAPPVKKHKIHGIGDLLNVAIAAIDKRKDKIIEFADSDGDGTTVTGVNLGIIKIKKEN